MKKILSIIIYGIELIITFLIIHIGITFITTHLLNQSTLHYKVQEGLIVNQITMILLLIIVRFGFIPIKIVTRSVVIIKFYKVMVWLLLTIHIVFLLTIGIFAFMIQESDSQVYEIRNLIFLFVSIYTLIYFISGFILYIKIPSAGNQKLSQ